MGGGVDLIVPSIWRFPLSSASGRGTRQQKTPRDRTKIPPSFPSTLQSTSPSVRSSLHIPFFLPKDTCRLVAGPLDASLRLILAAIHPRALSPRDNCPLRYHPVLTRCSTDPGGPPEQVLLGHSSFSSLSASSVLPPVARVCHSAPSRRSAINQRRPSAPPPPPPSLDGVLDSLPLALDHD